MVKALLIDIEQNEEDIFEESLRMKLMAYQTKT